MKHLFCLMHRLSLRFRGQMGELFLVLDAWIFGYEIDCVCLVGLVLVIGKACSLINFFWHQRIVMADGFAIVQRFDEFKWIGVELSLSLLGTGIPAHV